MKNVRRFSALTLLVACASAAMSVSGYDQVSVKATIPFAEKKLRPTVLQFDPAGERIWMLDEKESEILLLDEEGAPVSVNGLDGVEEPVDFCFDSRGRLVIADREGGAVRFFDLERSAAGITATESDKVAVESPIAVAVSGDDVIATAEEGADSIAVRSADGTLLHALFPPEASSFKDVSGIAYGRDGSLWALDAKRELIHRFGADRRWLGAVTGIEDPERMQRDEWGYAYVTSDQGRWFEVAPDGSIVGTFGTEGRAEGQMNRPRGVAIRDGRTVVVAEEKNRRFQFFDVVNAEKKERLRPEPASRVQLRMASTFRSEMSAYLVDADGKIFGLDAKKRRIAVREGETFDRFLGTKGRGLEGFNKSVDFVRAGDGFWVLDNDDHAIKKLESDGSISAIVGEKGRGDGELSGPTRLAMRNDGSFVVADKGGKRVQVLGKDGLFLFQLGERGKDPGQFHVATDLAVNADRIGLIDDSRKALLFFDHNGRFISEIANEEGQHPVWDELTRIATDAGGRFYVADHGQGRTRIFDRNGGYLADITVPVESVAVGGSQWLAVWSRGEVRLYDFDFLPTAVEKLRAEDHGGIAHVSWQSCRGCAGYKIYRADEGGDFRPFAETLEPFFDDDSVRPGKGVRYGVRGVNRAGYEGNWSESETILPSRRTDVSLVSIEDVTLNPVFAAAFKYYVNNPVGKIVIRNNDDKPVRNVKVSLSLRRYTDFQTEQLIEKLEAGETKEIPLTLTFNDRVLELNENTPVQADIQVRYVEMNENRSVSRNSPLTIYSRNAIVWSDKARISSFITPRDTPVLEFARQGIKAFLKELKGSTVGKPLAKAALYYEAMNALDIAYVPDPKTPFAEAAGNTEIIDYVQFPRETLRRRTGDCDDTTALLASLLESIGVETALVDTPGHILMMANLEESDAQVIGLPAERFVFYRGSLWVPIETTKLGASFIDAWNAGLSKVEAAREAGGLEFVSVISASEKYPAVTLVGDEGEPTIFPEEKAKPGFLAVLSALQKEKYERRVDKIKERMKNDPGNAMLEIQMGMAHVEGGMISAGKRIFMDLSTHKKPEVQSAAHNNLGNLAFLAGDFKRADRHYADASILSPDDGGILVNRARAAWKSGRADDAKGFLMKAKDLADDWRSYAEGMPGELLPRY